MVANILEEVTSSIFRIEGRKMMLAAVFAHETLVTVYLHYTASRPTRSYSY
jgi:hypothetical protein